MNGQLVVSAPETLLLTDDGRFPNSQLPVLLYRLAQMDELVAKLEARDWTNTWVNVIYSYHHYHSTAHELLVGDQTVHSALGQMQGRAAS